MEREHAVSGADPAARSRPWPGFALLGVVAAGAALAASELVAGLFVSAPSLVRTIGQRVIDVTPVPIVDWAIRMFGTNDKLVLVIGIVLVSLGIGALLGMLGRERPGLASTGFVVFGAVGFVVGLTDPLAGVVLTLVAAVAAAGMGVGVLLGLRYLLLRSAEPADGAVAGSRRAFVTAAAAAMVVAVGQAFLGRYFANRAGSAAVGREQVTLPTAFPTAEPATPTTAAGASEATVPEFEPIETAVPEFEPIDTPEAAGTTETTQAPETTTTQPASTETTQAPEPTTTTEPTQTGTTQPAETTTTQAAATETTQAPETTTTTQAPQTTTTQAPETTTTTQAPQTTTTQAPETTTTTQAPQTTTTQAPTTTTTEPTARPRVSGVAAPTAAQIAQVDGVSELITPNDEFYVIDTAIGVPQVDHRTWTLSFTGRADNPFSITYDELLAMPLVERYITLCCVSNQVGGNLVGNAKWLGVPLRTLVERAGVHRNGNQLVGRSVDRFTVGFPTAAVFDGREALVAVGMNGEPLPLRHGFPARLVVSGLYGYVSATKWLTEVEFTGWNDFDAYWVPRGWSKEGPIKTQSRIDTPREGNITAGTNVIAGVAWAQTRGISRVQVRVDDGDWTNAHLPQELSIDTWRQWYLEHDFTPGAHKIAVRATDGTGWTQTGSTRPPRPDGATGYHTIQVHAA
ncbi:molybdopterin-dependent oxidoreductase [Candidatus Spongiisocius sp.]|uniref:molybdopterin-dependent oxidoreductase n=1 Tax=Candidatus Spongiisocius sp. TaxID=3101273 RepID=UPI003B5B7C35